MSSKQTYKVHETSTLTYVHEVEASSPEEAEAIVYQGVENTVVDSFFVGENEIKVVLDEEESSEDPMGDGDEPRCWP